MLSLRGWSISFKTFPLIFLFLLSCGRYEYDQGKARICNESCDNDNTGAYLTEDKLIRHELVIRNGIFFHPDGTKVNKSGIYAMSLDERLYFKNLSIDRGRTFFHSFFMRGKPVLCTGWMVFKDGRLTLVNNNSGHYLPSPRNFFYLLTILAKKGIDFTGVETELR